MAIADEVAELRSIAEQAVDKARAAGADAAEALVQGGAELSVKVRMGEPELVHEAGSRALGLRVFKDHRSAVTYTSDFTPASFDEFIRGTVGLAALSEPDELNELPPEAELALGPQPELELWDDATLTVDAGEAIRRALRGEQAARDLDKRVTNSEGASYGRTVGASAFANSSGFSGAYRGSYQSLVVEPVCDDEGGKKRNGYHFTASRFLSGLEDPEHVGREAARKTLAKLGARKISTREAAVVFDPEAGRAILRLLFSVITGTAFYKKSSYLIGREGQPIASQLLTVVDDPLIPRAPGSRPYDGDGLPSRRQAVVEAGVLRTVLCDVYSARKLGRKSTGSAGRGVGGAPGVTSTNFVMQPGTTKGADVVAQTPAGLYVTDMMGFGFNPVTGDFSRGASGFWIENGKLTYPVSEITVSANLEAILQGIDLVGDDLDFRSSTAVPTFRVARMTIAGS